MRKYVIRELLFASNFERDTTGKSIFNTPEKFCDNKKISKRYKGFIKYLYIMSIIARIWLRDSEITLACNMLPELLNKSEVVDRTTFCFTGKNAGHQNFLTRFYMFDSSYRVHGKQNSVLRGNLITSNYYTAYLKNLFKLFTDVNL